VSLKFATKCPFQRHFLYIYCETGNYCKLKIIARGTKLHYIYLRTHFNHCTLVTYFLIHIFLCILGSNLAIILSRNNFQFYSNQEEEIFLFCPWALLSHKQFGHTKSIPSLMFFSLENTKRHTVISLQMPVHQTAHFK